MPPVLRLPVDPNKSSRLECRKPRVDLFIDPAIDYPRLAIAIALGTTDNLFDLDEEPLFYYFESFLGREHSGLVTEKFHAL
jgi:hypothetical protein